MNRIQKKKKKLVSVFKYYKIIIKNFIVLEK